MGHTYNALVNNIYFSAWNLNSLIPRIPVYKKTAFKKTKKNTQGFFTVIA